MSGTSKTTTLIRISYTTRDRLRDLKQAMNIRFDKDVIEKAVALLETAHANKLFDLVSKANKGVIHAKRRKSTNGRRS